MRRTSFGALAALLPLVALAAPTTYTQSVDGVTISPGNSVSCNNAGLHTDNAYLRVYDLSGVGPSVEVSGVTFGIEQAISNGGTGQPVEVRLYTLDPSSSFVYANLQSLGAFPATLPDTTGRYTVPTPGVFFDSVDRLVVELFTPDGQALVNSFFIGSNSAGQTGQGYIVAPACGIAEPVDLAAIGFPNMHILLDVEAEAGDPPSDADGDGIPDALDFFLSAASVPTPGAPFTPVAERAAPGKRVFFGATTGPLGAGPCGTTGNGGLLCADATGLKVIGSVIADASGTASITVTVPAALPLGRVLRFQAAYLTGSGDKTNVLTTETGLP